MASKKRIIRQLDYLKNLKSFLAEEKLPKLIFFDAHDVIDIVKGFEAWFSSPNRTGFKDNFFHSEKCFVQNLAAGRKFGTKISMIPPHQEEFYTKLSLGLGIEQNLPLDEEMLTELIYQTDTYRDQQDMLKRFRARKHRTKFVEDRAEEGIPNYKVALSVFKTTWKNRLRHFFRTEPIFRIFNEKLPYEEYLVSDIYKKLLAGFNDLRVDSAGRKNNFNDALSLAILHSLLERFNSGELEKLPIFFDSTGLFDEVVKETGLQKEFRIRRNGYPQESILRDTKYFIVHSIFSKDDDESDSQELLAHYAKIEEYKSKFAELERAGKIESFIEFNQEIETYINLNFLKHIMLECYADDSLQSIFSHMNIDTQAFSDDQFREVLDVDVETIKNDLLESIDQVIITQQMWDAINQGGAWLRDSVEASGKRLRPVSALRDLGVIRFSLPREAASNVEQLLGDEGVLSSDSETVQNAGVKLLGLLTEGTSQNNKSKALLSGLGALWALGRYPEVIKYSERYLTLHFSMGILRGSAMLRTGEYEPREILEIIRHLERQAAKNKDIRPRVMVGLAYLYFHLWAQENEVFSVNGVIPEESGENSWNNLAIWHARQAYDLLDKIPSSEEDGHLHELLRLYAQNQYIFYSIEAGDRKAFGEARKMINAFVGFKAAADYNWNFRFEDTIARFYHRVSMMFPEDKIMHLQHAREYAGRAARNPVGDLDQATRDYRARLDLLYTEAKLDNQTV